MNKQQALKILSFIFEHENILIINNKPFTKMTAELKAEFVFGCITEQYDAHYYIAEQYKH